MADSISIGLPAEGGSGAGGSTITENQVAHGFTLLDGIYHNGTIWVKAKADDADTVALYCVSEVSDVDNFQATKFGSITATEWENRRGILLSRFSKGRNPNFGRPKFRIQQSPILR